MSKDISHADCCTGFDPAPWDNKMHEWTDKLFIKVSIPQVLHFPLPGMFGRAVQKMWKMAQDADATIDYKDFLLLACDSSPWKSDLYMNVAHEVADAQNIKLSGKFFSKIFDGPFLKVPQYIREMDILLTRQNKLARRYFFYFATCPACAKKYGHNYIVAFAEL
jgi:hypothetical protein